MPVAESKESLEHPQYLDRSAQRTGVNWNMGFRDMNFKRCFEWDVIEQSAVAGSRIRVALTEHHNLSILFKIQLFFGCVRCRQPRL